MSWRISWHHLLVDGVEVECEGKRGVKETPGFQAWGTRMALGVFLFYILLSLGLPQQPFRGVPLRRSIHCWILQASSLAAPVSPPDWYDLSRVEAEYPECAFWVTPTGPGSGGCWRRKTWKQDNPERLSLLILKQVAALKCFVMKGSLKAFLGYPCNGKCPKKGRKDAVGLVTHRFLENFLWEMVGGCGFT